MRSGGAPGDVDVLGAREIACVQLADGPAHAPADLVDESRNARLLPGAGALDLTAFVEGLNAIGYEGPVSVKALSADLRRLVPRELAQAYLNAGTAFWSR